MFNLFIFLKLNNKTKLYANVSICTYFYPTREILANFNRISNINLEKKKQNQEDELDANS